MALVNIDSALTQLKRELKKIAPPGGIELLSYKRNRTVAIIKRGADLYQVCENGYVVQEFTIGHDQLMRKVKSCLKREFPRSRKIRFHKFQDPEELQRTHQKI